MILLEEERSARDGDSVLLGVAHAGENLLTGSIISCAVCIDYKHVSSNLIEEVLKGRFSKEVGADVKRAVRLFHFHRLDPIMLNGISDITTAVHYADFHALYGCVFEMFSKFSCDPDLVMSVLPIKEVVRNQDLSLYKNKDSKSSYVIMKDWNQFSNLIPNTTFQVQNLETTFTLLFARAMAQTMIDVEIADHKQKYPEYEFNLTTLTDSQAQLLKDKGMTEFHRAFLPELANFTFSKHILI